MDDDSQAGLEMNEMVLRRGIERCMRWLSSGLGEMG
jgi:hypothetical protein